MNENIVSIAQARELDQSGINEAVQKAIETSNFSMPDKLKSVVLKVNLRYYWDYSTGETTDPRVVSAVIDYIRNNVSNSPDIIVAEADASAMETKYAFTMLRYTDLSARKSVRLVNLCDEEKVKRDISVAGITLTIPIAKCIADTQLLINIPKMRTHRLTVVSCALKNIFGAIAVARKINYHSRLDEVIVAANKAMPSHLIIVDGIVALGKYPIKLGKIMAGQDPVAVDSVVARLMGYNPSRIRHLQIAQNEGLGTTESNKIKIQGEADPMKISRRFPRENYTLFNLSWSAKLWLLNAYLRVAGDTRPPVLDRSG
jgi:uncharacterized protein (DUF362 family)